MRTTQPKTTKASPCARAKADAPRGVKGRARAEAAGASESSTSNRKRYTRLRAIDGRHPLKRAVPGAVVRYPAKRRRDSNVAFFNFDLAREIGLIPARHPDRLDASLRRALLDTFSLVIVNEWDEEHDNQPHARDRSQHTYMATRYLQLQHPDKRGLNSGDGRSIWNGVLRGHAGSFDVSSCGTGVTRLCPATSALGRFFRTGNAITDYGCGTAHIDEGIGAALMSESFARNNIATERVLAVLSLPSGQAINVRVAPNLLRPSHFFGLLRRRNDTDLRQCVLYYAEREIRDGRWPSLHGERARIQYLAERVAIDFARAAATFESEYIFCWLDWDGDNVLCDGSIVDYGSVRQFGLYHHSYRFADSDRMSTSIPEQKRKARQIVQRFAQIRDLLLNDNRPALAALRNDAVLEIFDREFDAQKTRLFVNQLGFDEDDSDTISKGAPASLKRLMRLHRRLERRRSSRGPQRVADGLSWNAVYCMRDVLRELPQRLLDQSPEAKTCLRPQDFNEIALSDYASRKDRVLTPYRRRLAVQYQRTYLELCTWIASRRKSSLRSILKDIAPHARARNPYARMTGDGLTVATRRLTHNRGRLSPEETYRLIYAFANSQQRDVNSGDGTPFIESMAAMQGEKPLVQRIFRDMLRVARDYRETV